MIIVLLISILLILDLANGYKNLRAGRKGAIEHDNTVTSSESIKCGSTVLIKHIASKKCFTLKSNETSLDKINNKISKYDEWYIALETCDISNLKSHWIIHCCDQFMMRCTGDISNRNIDTSMYPKYASTQTHSKSKSNMILESLYNPIQSLLDGVSMLFHVIVTQSLLLFRMVG